MNMVLQEDELPYNCCEVNQGLHGDRKPLYEGEPHSGTFVVWRVFGVRWPPQPSSLRPPFIHGNAVSAMPGERACGIGWLFPEPALC